jgi:hypothetical protein
MIVVTGVDSPQIYGKNEAAEGAGTAAPAGDLDGTGGAPEGGQQPASSDGGIDFVE